MKIKEVDEVHDPKSYYEGRQAATWNAIEFIRNAEDHGLSGKELSWFGMVLLEHLNETTRIIENIEKTE